MLRCEAIKEALRYLAGNPLEESLSKEGLKKTRCGPIEYDPIESYKRVGSQ